MKNIQNKTFLIVQNKKKTLNLIIISSTLAKNKIGPDWPNVNNCLSKYITRMYVFFPP